MSEYDVWYMKSEQMRDFGMGVDFLQEHYPEKVERIFLDLNKTHIYLKSHKMSWIDSTLEDDLEAIFFTMQAENWSPNGEACELIREKGLTHTSMSVGDIVVVDKNRIFYVDNFGFTELK